MADRAGLAQCGISVGTRASCTRPLPFFRAALSRTLCRARRTNTLLLACVGLLAPSVARAQPVRPWLDWRTVETQSFVFHFPERYRSWTLALASRIEGVREQVGRVVGYVPSKRVHIVIDDPGNVANGTAWTPLDAPTIILYPTPPDPREEIGNYRVWAELLATHEFAHVAHLNRPSRNRLQQFYWYLSPVPLGPIPVNAPRWALEGYATYVEGKVTGSGRPNHAWRAAVLRQFALEGALPGYAQLSANGPWQTGHFAYLAGSAFLEWLARREGESSVTAIWRRMTAKTVRSFDEAFIGVYGDAPATLYLRFVAEVTADALAFERTLARESLVSGTLVQRLTHDTGDPAISPDGRFVALVVRHRTTPDELVVWGTADEPDTSAARRRELALKRDPEDVPARGFYPSPKRRIIGLMTDDGAPYESPRWMTDNKHLLVTRRMPMRDGTIRPDLFLWSAEDGTVRRVTSGAALRDADPSADGTWAAAVRCDRGWCDLVRVDLTTGQLIVLAAGSETRNYYRPRVSRLTGEIAVAEQLGDRWRVVRVSADGATHRYADPDDGVTRYDATFDRDGRTIFATSETNGVPNIERLDAVDQHPSLVTSVSGAAVAADVAPDGSIWFLSLQAGGYDLRRLHPDSASMSRARTASFPSLALLDSLSPILPPRATLQRPDSTVRPRRADIGDVRSYGLGPSRFRYLPGGTTGFGGSSLVLGLARSDPVGRLGMVVLGAVGAGSLPAGVGFNATYRASPTERVLNLWTSHDGPSARFAPAFAAGLDLTRSGGALRMQRTRVLDGGEVLGTVAVLAERQHSAAFGSRTRDAALAAFALVSRQRDEELRYVEQLSAVVEGGGVEGNGYYRHRSMFFFGVGSGSRPLTTARFNYGAMGGGERSRYERFALGGFASPLIEPLFDGRRVDAPAYPAGSVTSTSFASFRVALPLPPVEAFYAGTSPDAFETSLRSYGFELRQHVASVSALGTPEVDILAGFARALDAPVARTWRYYLTLAVKP